MRKRLRALEEHSVKQLADWDQKIEDNKDELAQITKKNTMWLERVAKLTKAQYDLEDQLNGSTKNVHVTDSRPADQQADADRQQLLQMLRLAGGGN